MKLDSSRLNSTDFNKNNIIQDGKFTRGSSGENFYKSDKSKRYWKLYANMSKMEQHFNSYDKR